MPCLIAGYGRFFLNLLSRDWQLFGFEPRHTSTASSFPLRNPRLDDVVFTSGQIFLSFSALRCLLNACSESKGLNCARDLAEMGRNFPTWCLRRLQRIYLKVELHQRYRWRGSDLNGRAEVITRHANSACRNVKWMEYHDTTTARFSANDFMFGMILYPPGYHEDLAEHSTPRVQMCRR